MHDFYVYEHWRPDKNECFYVGKGRKRRSHDMAANRNCGHRAVVTYLATLGMMPDVRLIATGITEAAAFALEIETIRKYGREDHGGPLVNRSDGGEGSSGTVASPEIRAKLSAAKLGKKRSAEHIAHMSAVMKAKNPFKGKTHSAETREKISAKCAAAWIDKEYRERTLSRMAASRTDEWRANIGNASRGRRASEETRAKLSALRMGNKSHLGRTLTAEHRRNISIGNERRWAVKKAANVDSSV